MTPGGGDGVEAGVTAGGGGIVVELETAAAEENGNIVVEVGSGGSSFPERLLDALALLAVEIDDRTLSTELVAEKLPEISVGVVPAREIVGVVGRPWALELSLLTELELAAGVTEESELDRGSQPELSW